MALLNEHGRRARTGVVRGLVVTLPLTVLGCALLFGGTSNYGFSHRVHSADAELECSDCHSTAKTADDPGMPALRQCMLCHDEKDKAKPPEQRASALYDASGLRAAHVAKLGDEIVFSHRMHVDKVGECNACHKGIETNDRLDAAIAVDMTECMACHAKVNAPNECATCHKSIRADVAPRTHDADWRRYHGKVVRAHSEARVDECSMCHTESSCTACHQDMAPTGHDNYFRRRGHGVMARMDRESCAACHRTDSCDRCHAEVRPLTHSGSWAGPRNTHCLSCHFPLAADECSTCHRDTPSHATAAPPPASHTPGMNCRQCHGLTAPLPHVENGDECARCHR